MVRQNPIGRLTAGTLFDMIQILVWTRSKRVGCGDFLRESSDKKIIENAWVSLGNGRKYYDFDWVLGFRTWKL